MVYWLACYKDGSTVKQDQGKSYDVLDRNNLEAFVLMFEDKAVLTIWLDNRQLVWRLRREIIPGGGEYRVHLAGWRERIGNEIQQTLCYIFEQYNELSEEVFPLIHIAGKFDRQRNRFMNQPVFREFEVFPGEIYYINKKVIIDGNEETVQESRIKE